MAGVATIAFTTCDASMTTRWDCKITAVQGYRRKWSENRHSNMYRAYQSWYIHNDAQYCENMVKFHSLALFRRTRVSPTSHPLHVLPAFSPHLKTHRTQCDGHSHTTWQVIYLACVWVSTVAFDLWHHYSSIDHQLITSYQQMVIGYEKPNLTSSLENKAG